MGVCDTASSAGRFFCDDLSGVQGTFPADQESFRHIGKGGQPEGIVFSEGELVYGSLSQTYDIYGFDNNNVFICGRMTGQTAQSFCW